MPVATVDTLFSFARNFFFVSLKALNLMASSDPFSFNSGMSHSRLVPLQGAVNFRDIGGYATNDGRNVRWGRVYRSALISGLTDADLEVLTARRILTIVDLREADEVAKAPDRVPPEAEIIHCCAGVNPMDDWTHMLAGATSGVPFMRAFYSDTHGLATRFKPFFKALLDLPSDRALLVHCMAGKDRTGIGVALLLLALGVPQTSILEDYLMTNKYGMTTLNPNVKHLMRMDVPDSVARDLLAARPEYLQAFFGSLEIHHGSSEQFLAQALGLTKDKIELLREKFTE